MWTGDAIANYESHQPPAFYLLGAGVLRIGGLDENPVTALLAVRLLCVSFVIIGLVAVRQIDAASFLLLSFVLLLPGAAESLARAANDALLFLACAALMYAATKKRTAMLFIAAAAAPLIKLTAFPFVAAVAAREWFEGRKLRGVAIAAASLLVVPIQAARGWAWGGTVELNQSRFAIDEPLMDSLIGMLRSIYTITKTTIWLGNWSFFKAPVALLAIIALLGVVTLLFTRVRGTASGRVSFLCGLGVLGAGVVAFAVAHRSLFGEWGGVGGWYIWGVMPWIIVGLTDNLRVTDRARMPVAACWAAVLIVTNALWFRSASTLYGLL